MNRDFYEFCWEQFRQDLRDTDTIFQRVSVMQIVLPVIVAGSYAIGRPDLVTRCFERVDVFLYCLATAVVFVAVAYGIFQLFRCVHPGDRYRNVATVDFWDKWQRDMAKYLETQEQTAEETEKAFQKAFFEDVCPKLAEAQPHNARLNDQRRKAFYRSVSASVIAVMALAVQGLIWLAMEIQGV